MTTHDDDRDADRRRYQANKDKMAENQAKIAYLTGKTEAIYEGLPSNEGLIAEIMEETGASREKVVERLKVISEREVARVRDQLAAPGPADDAPLDPAVKRFREMLS